MHPPLYQAHPLCQKEVEAFTRCHDENPWLKFFNACGDAESVMNACFREEKALRRQLNREKGPVSFLKIVKRPAEGAGAPAVATGAPVAAGKQQQ
jgi:COX assembly mitochondrial protein 2